MHLLHLPIIIPCFMIGHFTPEVFTIHLPCWKRRQMIHLYTFYVISLAFHITYALVSTISFSPNYKIQWFLWTVTLPLNKHSCVTPRHLYHWQADAFILRPTLSLHRSEDLNFCFSLGSPHFTKTTDPTTNYYWHNLRGNTYFWVPNRVRIFLVLMYMLSN
jgi:hypothetical protein